MSPLKRAEILFQYHDFWILLIGELRSPQTSVPPNFLTIVSQARNNEKPVGATGGLYAWKRVCGLLGLFWIVLFFHRFIASVRRLAGVEVFSQPPESEGGAKRKRNPFPL